MVHKTVALFEKKYYNKVNSSLEGKRAKKKGEKTWKRKILKRSYLHIRAVWIRRLLFLG